MMNALVETFLSWYERHERIEAKQKCCDLGVRVPCVCRVSVKCPVHGTICVGTHD